MHPESEETILFDDDGFPTGAKFTYHKLVGSLLYAAICTRPDIAFAVGACSCYVSNLGKAYWCAAMHILQ